MVLQWKSDENPPMEIANKSNILDFRHANRNSLFDMTLQPAQSLCFFGLLIDVPLQPANRCTKFALQIDGHLSWAPQLGA